MTRAYEEIVVERRERAVCVTLNRPEARNPLSAMVGTDDLREGFAAFLEKRPPRLTGR
jgi:enoyl-CoA hydratase/carnithine racemase